MKGKPPKKPPVPRTQLNNRNTIRCRNCGRPMAGNAKVCPQCGTPKRSKGFVLSLISVFFVFLGWILFGLKLKMIFCFISQIVAVVIALVALILSIIEKNTVVKGNVWAIVWSVAGIILSILMLLAGGLSGYFMWTRLPNGTVTVEKVGEIYRAKVDEEHIGKTEEGILFADNEILVNANHGVSYEQIETLAKSYEAEIVGWIELVGSYQLKFPKVHSKEELDSLVEKFESEKIVDTACMNYITEIIPTQVHYGERWESDLMNSGDLQGKSWGIEAIHAPEAWKKLDQNQERVNPIRLGAIDCGFNPAHEDLSGCIQEVFYNHPDDHGNHVAGIMAADSQNDKGICGVYPYGNGNFYGASFEGAFDAAKETGIYSSCMEEICCYAELLARNVKVINCSYGYLNVHIFADYCGDAYVREQNQNVIREEATILGSFLQDWINMGYDFVIVNASGNDSNSKFILDYNGITETIYTNWVDAGHGASQYSAIRREDYPDVYDRIIVVGSLDKNLNTSSFSNVGDRVDVYAPGEEIYSCVVGNQEYAYMNGTSMASPHVAGVAAMVWAADNSLTGAQVKQIVCETASGMLVDANQAVSRALNVSSEFLEEIPNPELGEIEPDMPEVEMETEAPINPVENNSPTPFPLTDELVGKGNSTNNFAEYGYACKGEGDVIYYVCNEGHSIKSTDNSLTITDTSVKFFRNLSYIEGTLYYSDGKNLYARKVDEEKSATIVERNCARADLAKGYMVCLNDFSLGRISTQRANNGTLADPRYYRYNKLFTNDAWSPKNYIIHNNYIYYESCGSSALGDEAISRREISELTQSGNNGWAADKTFPRSESNTLSTESSRVYFPRESGNTIYGLSWSYNELWIVRVNEDMNSVSYFKDADPIVRNISNATNSFNVFGSHLFLYEGGLLWHLIDHGETFGVAETAATVYHFDSDLVGLSILPNEDNSFKLIISDGNTVHYMDFDKDGKEVDSGELK